METNGEMTNSIWKNFGRLTIFKSFTKQLTGFNNLENPTRIDHILANHPKGFHPSSIFETGLSDFHKSTLTVLKVFA